METKFTKGPWNTEYKELGYGTYGQAVFDANGEDICVCSWYQVKEFRDGKLVATSTNREANANLISAAPEMYEFIESLQLSVVDEVKRDSLLAKARGESQ